VADSILNPDGIAKQSMISFTAHDLLTKFDGRRRYENINLAK
jgi:hypothetical protein